MSERAGRQRATAAAAAPGGRKAAVAAAVVRPAAEAGAGRRAHGVTPELKQEALLRLRRIEGQVRGLQRMVEEERYCVDVLGQIRSVQRALGGAGRLLTRNHLEHCVTRALRSGDAREAERAYEELLELLERS